jgi:predicted dehydrogenase
MLRGGLVGTGDAARHHGRALSSLAAEGSLAWTAIAGRDAARLAEALIDARACDAVVFATPDGIHAEQVERAARAGLHVLVEKPVAIALAAESPYAAQLRELVARAPQGFSDDPTLLANLDVLDRIEAPLLGAT